MALCYSYLVSTKNSEGDESESMASDTKIDEAVNELSRRILEGDFATGERLPSERDLAEDMHVSRQTVRAALLRLQSENMIDIVPKSGIYVRFPRIHTPVGPWVPAHLKDKGAAGLYKALEEQVQETHMRFLEPPFIAEARGAPGIKMNLKVRTKVLRRYRLCIMNQKPYRLLDSYYPADLLPEDVLKNPDAARQSDSPLQWLCTYAEPTPPDAYERLMCRMPDAKEAELLNINRNQPIVQIERWIFISDGSVFEYTVIIANAALHEFTYTYEKANWEDLTNKIHVGS